MTAPATKFDAPIGSPPTLEWVGVERLAVDESYQRATDSSRSRNLIFSIASRWNWALCQPLVVSRRDDGSLYVIDGRHRLSGAAMRGDIPHLPCVIVSGQMAEDEAKTFVALNTRRQRLSQADIFNAMLAAGDEAAKATAQMLDETGWRQIRATAVAAPGQLMCGPMVTNAVRVRGAPIVRNSLTALREAYHDTPVGNAATLLKALFCVYADHAEMDADAFIEALGSIPPSEWELEAADARRVNPGLTRIESLAAAMWAEYESLVADKRLAA